MKEDHELTVRLTGTPEACYRPFTDDLYDLPLSVAVQCGLREALRARVLTTIEHPGGVAAGFKAFAYDGGVYVGDGAMVVRAQESGLKEDDFAALDASTTAPIAREVKAYGHGRYSVWTDGEIAAVFHKSRVEPFRLLTDVRLGRTRKGDPALFGRDNGGALLAACTPLWKAGIEWRGTKTTLACSPARTAPGALVKEPVR